MIPHRLVFGTSTFAAGKLRPGKDSQPGIDALAAALARGIRAVHSNPNLGTQWAVRTAAEQAGLAVDVRHLIKIQVPLHLSSREIKQQVDMALETSLRDLNVATVDTVVIEVDIKRTTDPGLLADHVLVADVYEQAARHAIGTKLARRAMAYCHSPAHLLACLPLDGLAGYAAQHNLIEAWPGLFLDQIAATGREFLAMAPLARGRLTTDSSERISVSPPHPLPPLRWVLGHPAVTAAVITISSVQHLNEAIAATHAPEEEETVRRDLDRWKRGEVLTSW